MAISVGTYRGDDGNRSTKYGTINAAGFLMSLLQATGIAGIVSLKSQSGITTGLKVGALSWLLFALPITAYRRNYTGTPLELLQIDAGYLLIGYLLMGAVFAYFVRTNRLYKHCNSADLTVI